MILKDILHQKQSEIAALSALSPDKVTPATDGFARLFADKPFVVIAEMKAKSPSEGVMCQNYQPADIAGEYAAGGADAISVLTDPTFFGGQLADIKKVKKICDLPVLCKDFILDAKQVLHARQAGADACLLIVKVLSDKDLKRLYDLIIRLGMSALVEVFDQQDIERVRALQPTLVGINNRNLDSLKMDTGNSKTLRRQIDWDAKVISLSGVRTPTDIIALQGQFDGVLVGTALMRAASARQFLQDAQHGLHSVGRKNPAQ